MNIKEIIIAILMVTFGVLNAYFWKNLIFSGSYSNFAIFSLPVASLFLFTISFALFSMLGKNTILGVGSVITAFVGSFFFIKASVAVLSGLTLTLIFALWAFQNIRLETKGQNIPKIRRILSQGLPLFFTAVAVMISIFYFVGIAKTESGALLPKAAVELSLPFLESTLQNLVPGFQASATIDDLLKKNLEGQLAAAKELLKTPAAEIQKLIEEERQALESGFGIEISGDERAGDLIYKLANRKIEDFFGEYSRFIPYLSAFGFFLAIKVLAVPLYLISLCLVWLTIKILLAFGLIKKYNEMMEVERLRL